MLRKPWSSKPLSLATRLTYLPNPEAWIPFLALYTKITKDDVRRNRIRRNRNNAAERLGFLGRVIHGTNPRAWLKEVKQRAGKGIDFATAIGE